MPEHPHSPGGLPGFVELLVAFAALAAVFSYLFAAAHTRRGGPWPAHRSVLWVCGIGTAAASVVGPVADAAHGDFRTHMVAHLLLGMVAPLLLVLAAPVTLALRTLDLTPARRLSRLLRSAPVRLVSHPLTAAVLSTGGLWLIYATPLFASMHANRLISALVMAHVFASGYLFTAAMVGIDPDAHRASYRARAIVLVAALAGHGILAKYLYGHPPAGVDRAAAESGSMLMYYGGDVVDIVLMVLLCAGWLLPSRAERRRSTLAVS